MVAVLTGRVGLDGQEKVSFVWLRVGPAGQDIGGTTVPSR